MLGEIYKDIKVVRNDAITIEEISEMDLDGIIISPGPGRPEDAGICIEVIKNFTGKLPILGICLGHQAIGHAFGGNVIGAEKIMHGKTSEIYTEACDIFRDMPERFNVMRYHSLVVKNNGLPEALKVIAKTEDDVIMGVKHKEHELYGLQFHPESILTQYGDKMLRNFVEVICNVE
jgi:anthranilate synthase component 2